MQAIADILAQTGPLTGAELAAAGGFTDILALWRACHASGLLLRRTGRRYLRLDSAVAGYARLSPSIRREFLTYTLVGLARQQAALETRAAELEQQPPPSRAKSWTSPGNASAWRSPEFPTNPSSCATRPS